MGTIIYCDRVKHEVRDHWHEVATAIGYVTDVENGGVRQAEFTTLPPGFIAVMPKGDPADAASQLWLRASAITSICQDGEAVTEAQILSQQVERGQVPGAGNNLAEEPGRV